MNCFDGKVVLVTGAARGIGAACAEAFEERGATVIRSDRNDTDLTIRTEVEALFARIVRDHGPLDVLVANAGVAYGLTTETATQRDWDDCMNVNLRSIWWTAQMAAPLLREVNGNIVTIASYQGLRSGRKSFPYSVAKGGVLALTRSLAVELAPEVRVNAIIPGQVESVRTEDYFQKFREPDKARQRVLQTFPLRRLGLPEDIAHAVRFLASSEAAWITGTFLTVDGGRDAALADFSDLEQPIE